MFFVNLRSYSMSYTGKYCSYPLSYFATYIYYFGKSAHSLAFFFRFSKEILHFHRITLAFFCIHDTIINYRLRSVLRCSALPETLQIQKVLPLGKVVAFNKYVLNHGRSRKSTQYFFVIYPAKISVKRKIEPVKKEETHHVTH